MNARRKFYVNAMLSCLDEDLKEKKVPIQWVGHAHSPNDAAEVAMMKAFDDSTSYPGRGLILVDERGFRAKTPVGEIGPAEYCFTLDEILQQGCD